MTAPSLTLRHICFTGPEKEPASLQFGSGLNVIYGASDTGKSFVIDALDFMLGASGELRDIPQRVGYDRIFLGLEMDDTSAFTLERSTSGGDFKFYDGLHFTSPEDIEPIILGGKHSKVKDNISSFMLSKIDLDSRQLKRNKNGDTQSFTLRNLAHLCLISETDIQKRGSPFETGQFTSATSELAAFKLLLTGVDDSSLQSKKLDQKEALTRSAKIEVIDELIIDYKERTADLVSEEETLQELADQLQRLEHTRSRESLALKDTEFSYRQALKERNSHRLELETIGERSSEISEVLARFRLLDLHYGSDLSRLEGIREAGSLVVALDSGDCSLCGAAPSDQHLESECDGNVEAVIAAADAERVKITGLRDELDKTARQLNSELEKIKAIEPAVLGALSSAEVMLQKMSPDVSSQRTVYSEIIEKRSIVRSAMELMGAIEELELRKIELETKSTEGKSDNLYTVDLSTSVTDDFSIFFEEILKSWNFPNSERVHYDSTKRDFVIAGKLRGNRGKGLRAISHAAFSVALMRYAEDKKLPYSGFVVLDTPLLAYREPEGDDDDLRGTDVQDRFYEYLSKWTSRQVIVFENDDPPQYVKDGLQTVFFTKNEHIGRFGFFPVQPTPEDLS